MAQTIERLDVDVLVVGAGLAGTMAAAHAARCGARVALASLGRTFSGSSFHGSTWGLGLVGPKGASDRDDLADAIVRVGRGMADPTLAGSLADGIPDALAALEAFGVRLAAPKREDEREFIPCFDDRHRLWRGIERAPYAQAMGEALARLRVTLLPHCELVDLIAADGSVAGALLFDHGRGRLFGVSCPATVLATGGMAGLFARPLCAPDVVGSAHAMAASVGCRLTNLEFLQIMPGIKNVGAVFNEKTFRWASLVDDAGRDVLSACCGRDGAAVRELLELRSGHGPFSARLASREVDLAVAAAGPDGVRVRYDLPDGPLPEFVERCFSWLESRSEAGAELCIALQAQASNGGILVDEVGFTGTDGLFAAGEATGGMHGADRIGGLASANALVFGMRSGRAAAARAKRERGIDPPAFDRSLEDALERLAAPAAQDGVDATRTAACLMERCCLVPRTGAELAACCERLETLAHRSDAGPGINRPSPAGADSVDLAGAIAARRAAHQATSAAMLAASALARTESRGAHFRSDFPNEDPALARPFAVTLENGDVRCSLSR